MVEPVIGEQIPQACEADGVAYDGKIVGDQTEAAVARGCDCADAFGDRDRTGGGDVHR
ncbi:MAG: hypothetical protein WBB57_01910 [Mycobacterium sp.]